MSHCLVIDDSKLIRTIHCRMLAQLGLTVSEAENGEDALGVCSGRMPDLILVDWNMPVMDGFTFLKTLRAMPAGSAPKVVLCTIESDLEHISRALAEGADEYIMKPFDVEILATKLIAAGIALSPRPQRPDPLADGR
ncbi:two-component system response regulator [Magnetospirillum sp. ME-1]|uniref:response regulator n=1 Tax=Magnetospirillum sp. ME-1 TaxID=1639348 RepID=UPI000A17DB4F|nr:response regulator [Magnetospirillum sp. ME-1]ARJ68057.1 two-component system response regulator [Magnetospirillum sp. ME-1]